MVLTGGAVPVVTRGAETVVVTRGTSAVEATAANAMTARGVKRFMYIFEDSMPPGCLVDLK